MCGFIGILSSNEQHRAAFEPGLEAIAARGIFVDRLETAGEQYAYARLPTDDVANEGLGRVPDCPCKLFFNGLLTNVDYLAEAYHLPAGAAASDNRCLEFGLRRYGAAFLQQCRGMFAAALVTEEAVMLMRDTIGVKPLYYVCGAGTFAFASEFKALQTLGLPVHEVAPGQIVHYEKTGRRVGFENFNYQSYKNYRPDQLEVALNEAVVMSTRRYLEQSDKPVAVLLSGGVDSSVTAALLVAGLSGAHKRRLVAFCVGDDDSADVQTAQKLAARLRLRFVRVRPYSAEVSLRRLPGVVYAVESPYARVAKAGLLYDALAVGVKRYGIDVVIGGEGADELFHGYHRFIEGLTYEQSGGLFRLFFVGVFPATLLQRYDRMFARHCIEGRVPYLDQEVVELAGRIEAAKKVRYGAGEHVSKLPLRAVAKRIGLPSYIYDRRKEKMTQGATGRPNEPGNGGYLEMETQRMAGVSFETATRLLYDLQFGGTEACRGRVAVREEQVMGLANGYRMINKLGPAEGTLV